MKRLRPAGGARTPRCSIVIAAAIALLPLACQALAGNGAPVPASTIHSVWNARIDCSGPTSIARNRRADEAAIKASGRVEFAAGAYTFTVPALVGMSDAIVLLVEGDRSRGVVDHYALLVRDDVSPPFAAVVVTELPEGLAGDTHSALVSAAGMQVGNAMSALGQLVIFSPVTGTIGPAIEMLVPGRTGSYCYPTSQFELAHDGEAPTLGISRFTVDGRYLIEYSLIVPAPEGVPFDNVTQARVELARLEESLTRSGRDP